MDFTPIIAQAWGMLAWFIPAALLIGPAQVALG